MKYLQIVERWEKLFNLPPLVTRYLRGETTTKAENKEAERLVVMREVTSGKW